MLVIFSAEHPQAAPVYTANMRLFLTEFLKMNKAYIRMKRKCSYLHVLTNSKNNLQSKHHASTGTERFLTGMPSLHGKLWMKF